MPTGQSNHSVPPWSERLRSTAIALVLTTGLAAGEAATPPTIPDDVSARMRTTLSAPPPSRPSPTQAPVSVTQGQVPVAGSVTPLVVGGLTFSDPPTDAEMKRLDTHFPP
jgi:hypothetical protein